jgi:UDP-N-acetylmuramoyl-tripeptide--D-alanyl-D-alanine ligase
MPVTLPLSFVLEATGGRVVGPAPAAAFAGVTTDSRAVPAGSLFVALAGGRFDGHDFVAAARAAGAAGALVAAAAVARVAAAAPGLPLVAVPDTLRALGELAAAARRARPLTVVAVTGSNGKTTTKEMLAAALAARGPLLKTEGNLNNLIGLPRTILGLADGVRTAVLEMGMNTFGEIARMTEIARPDVGVITNVGPVHLEGLGSVEGVRRAKLELFRGMPAGATAIVNADDPMLADGADALPLERVTVALAGEPGGALARGRRVDVVATAGDPDREGRTPLSLETPAGRASLRLPALGRHQAMNAALAAAGALATGASLAEVAAGLERFRPIPGRFEQARLRGDVRLVNDAYNANPASMAASLATFCALPLPPGALRVAALGEMRELGREAARLHRELGARVARLPIDRLYVYGEHAGDVVAGAREAGWPEGRAVALESHEAIAEAIAGRLPAGSAVFIKGSRGATMDRVAAALERRLGRQGRD